MTEERGCSLGALIFHRKLVLLNSLILSHNQKKQGRNLHASVGLFMAELDIFGLLGFEKNCRLQD